MFDVKLMDGRYFKNVEIWVADENPDFTNDITFILQTDKILELTQNNENYTTLATIKNNDIEYICNTYEYKSN